MRRGHGHASLYRLIYCSRNAILPGGDPGERAEALREAIRSILDTARARNEADGVTGALLFTGSGFAQVLEGPREVVERTFERIGADPRHTDVSVLTFTPTEKRSFPDWAMGFCGHAHDAADDPLAGILPQPGEPGAPPPEGPGRRAPTGSDVLRLLERLVRREEEWIAA